MKKDVSKNTCYIVAAGDKAGAFTPKNGDFVIAADGGQEFLKELKVTPDLAVGDFDSSSSIPEDCLVIKFNIEKDETDTAIAVNEGLARGYRRFEIYGGLGGRLDHSIANIQLICSLSTRGCDAKLIGNKMTVTAVTDGELRLPAKKEGTVSVFSHSDISSGVTIKGLKYPLTDATLSNMTALGVSNEFTGKPAVIAVKTGTLLIMWSE